MIKRGALPGVALLTAATAALAQGSCAPQGVKAPPSVKLGVAQASRLSALKRNLKALKSSPLDFNVPFHIFALPFGTDDFSCFAVNVTGDLVQASNVLSSASCSSTDNMVGNGFGVVSSAFSIDDTVDVTVPSGTPLNFDVYGLYPTPTACDGTDSGITGYFLGSVSQTIQDNTTILVPIDYDGSAADLACGPQTIQMGGAVQGVPLDLEGDVTTFAGVPTSSSLLNATGSLARFADPTGTVVVGNTTYVTDLNNNLIRAIDNTTGAVTSFTSVVGPEGICSDGTNLYVGTTQSEILVIPIATATPSVLAGDGTVGEVDGSGTGANFDTPYAVATDGTNVYVADFANNNIRTVPINGSPTSHLAGSTVGTGGSTNANGTSAFFNGPEGIATDGVNLYVADTGNRVIREVSLTGPNPVTTLAGSGAEGSMDAVGTAATFDQPFGAATDGTNVYVTDYGNSNIRQINISSGQTATLAGNAGTTGYADGTGTSALFNLPQGLSLSSNLLLIADSSNDTIRELDLANDAVTTIAGAAGSPGSVDGEGPAARLSGPYGITTDGVNLYVADSTSSIIRQISLATGEVTTLAGLAQATGNVDGFGDAARFQNPTGITTDGVNLYVADTNNETIRQVVIATGYVSTLAGQVEVTGFANGTGTAATFTTPVGITTDGTNLYVTDRATNIIRQIVIATAAVTTLAGTANTTGATNATGAAASFNSPAGITTDGTNLYVVDSANYLIRQIVISTAVVTTLAGSGLPGNTNNPGLNASFYSPEGITCDGTNLYVTDTNEDVRQIVIATAEVSTVAGQATSIGSTDGIGTNARFNGIRELTTDGVSLYVTDSNNNTIRQIQ